MNIKKEDLEKLSEIEISELITQLQKLQKDNKTSSELIIRKKDAQKLKEYLEIHNNKISKNMEKVIDLNLSEKDIEYINQFMEIQNWEKIIYHYRQESNLMNSIFKSPELLSFFIEKDLKFLQLNLEATLKHSKIETINKDVLELLFSKNLIKIDESHENNSLLFAFNRNIEVLIYGLENHHIKIEKKKLLPIIYKGFEDIQTQELKKLLTFLPENTKLSFKSLYESLWDIHMSENLEEGQKLEVFLAIKNDNFNVMLETLQVPSSYVLSCVKLFDKKYKHYNYDDDSATVEEAKKEYWKNIENKIFSLLDHVVSHEKDNKNKINQFLEQLHEEIKLDEKDNDYNYSYVTDIKELNFLYEKIEYYLRAVKLDITLPKKEKNNQTKKLKV